MDTTLDFACYAFLLLALDVILYGMLVPFIASFAAGSLTEYFELLPSQEVLLVVEFTFILFSLLTTLNLERKFWQKLLEQADEKWMTLLEVRTVYNGASIAWNLVALVNLIQSISHMGEMKEKNLGEDITIIMRHRFKRFYSLSWFGFESNSLDLIKSKSTLSAEMVMTIGQLFGDIALLLYLTTVTNYLNAVIILNNNIGQLVAQERENRDNNNPAEVDVLAADGDGLQVDLRRN